MWEPQPGWHPLPGGTGASTVGLWRSAQGGRPVVIKRLAAPTPQDPAELSDPGHVGVLATRGRRARHRAHRRYAGAARGPAPRSRRTPRASRSPGTGSRTPPSAACSWRMALGRFAGADLPRPRFLARAPARRPDGAGRAPRRLADPGPDHGRRRRRPPVATAGARCSTSLDGAAAGAAARRPDAGEPPRARRRRRARHRLGHARHRPGRRRPRLLLARRAGGVRAAARRLPAWACRRASPRPTRSLLGARVDRRLHRAQPGRVGAGPGRPAARARWPGSTATPRWPRTCARCSGSSLRSRRCWA